MWRFLWDHFAIFVGVRKHIGNCWEFFEDLALCTLEMQADDACGLSLRFKYDLASQLRVSSKNY